MKFDDIKTVWEGRYVTVDLVDTTTECFIQEGVYSLTQMIDLYEELADAFGVTIKELKKLDHDVTYSEEMQAKLVEAKTQVPLAMADAFRSGNLGIMDYYRMRNVEADTEMRDSISKGTE